MQRNYYGRSSVYNWDQYLKGGSVHYSQGPNRKSVTCFRLLSGARTIPKVDLQMYMTSDMQMYMYLSIFIQHIVCPSYQKAYYKLSKQIRMYELWKGICTGSFIRYTRNKQGRALLSDGGGLFIMITRPVTKFPCIKCCKTYSLANMYIRFMACYIFWYWLLFLMLRMGKDLWRVVYLDRRY